jgi:hypothetical protein
VQDNFKRWVPVRSVEAGWSVGNLLSFSLIRDIVSADQVEEVYAAPTLRQRFSLHNAYD